METKFLVLAGLLTMGALVTYNLSSSAASSSPASSSPVLSARAQFASFKAAHKKVYSSQSEEEFRFGVFQKRLVTIEEHNRKNLSYKKGINHMSDMTYEELFRFYTSQTVLDNSASRGKSSATVKDGEVVDWRKKGVVTPVKNQGQCGSCWAFSATGSLESFYALQNKLKGDDLKQFSEQELVDCSGAQGNEGCGGGLMNYAFDYVIKNKIAIEEEYPYRAKNMKCKADKTKTRYTLAEYKTLTKETANVEELAKLIKTQPISVAFEVQEDFFDYKSGVYKASSDCGDALNHGVLAVGYNTKKKVPYFIVKNSWAESWGLKGYFLMAIGKGRGTCGIANPWDTYPTKI